jgi:predicted TIM-barrel fold metal-dependent hydrolase
MDAAGIETGILSMPARPGMVFGDAAAARKLCRDSNEYMAELHRARPGRFGFFAALPLPDVEGSLTELAYALDSLKADGVGVWSSYGTTYLGDPAFAPLWAELDRRRAVVFSHATDAECCVNPVPVMGETVTEFAADTTRAIGSWIFSGSSTHFPNLKFIFSHGGGNMPFVIDRFHNQMENPKTAALVPNGVDFELRKLYYDTAFAASGPPMAALTKLVPMTQIVVGTDYPYTSGARIVDELATCGVTPHDLALIGRENAAALLRR